jgi:hypothetical protein
MDFLWNGMVGLANQNFEEKTANDIFHSRMVNFCTFLQEDLEHKEVHRNIITIEII